MVSIQLFTWPVTPVQGTPGYHSKKSTSCLSQILGCKQPNLGNLGPGRDWTALGGELVEFPNAGLTLVSTSPHPAPISKVTTTPPTMNFKWPPGVLCWPLPWLQRPGWKHWDTVCYQGPKRVNSLSLSFLIFLESGPAFASRRTSPRWKSVQILDTKTDCLPFTARPAGQPRAL